LNNANISNIQQQKLYIRPHCTQCTLSYRPDMAKFYSSQLQEILRFQYVLKETIVPNLHRHLQYHGRPDMVKSLASIFIKWCYTNEIPFVHNPIAEILDKILFGRLIYAKKITTVEKFLQDWTNIRCIQICLEYVCLLTFYQLKDTEITNIERKYPFLQLFYLPCSPTSHNQADTRAAYSDLVKKFIKIAIIEYKAYHIEYDTTPLETWIKNDMEIFATCVLHTFNGTSKIYQTKALLRYNHLLENLVLTRSVAASRKKRTYEQSTTMANSDSKTNYKIMSDVIDTRTGNFVYRTFRHFSLLKTNINDIMNPNGIFSEIIGDTRLYALDKNHKYKPCEFVYNASRYKEKLHHKVFVELEVECNENPIQPVCKKRKIKKSASRTNVRKIKSGKCVLRIYDNPSDSSDESEDKYNKQELQKYLADGKKISRVSNVCGGDKYMFQSCEDIVGDPSSFSSDTESDSVPDTRSLFLVQKRPTNESTIMKDYESVLIWMTMMDEASYGNTIYIDHRLDHKFRTRGYRSSCRNGGGIFYEHNVRDLYDRSKTHTELLECEEDLCVTLHSLTDLPLGNKTFHSIQADLHLDTITFDHRASDTQHDACSLVWSDRKILDINESDLETEMNKTQTYLREFAIANNQLE